MGSQERRPGGSGEMSKEGENHGENNSTQRLLHSRAGASPRSSGCGLVREFCSVLESMTQSLAVEQ